MIFTKESIKQDLSTFKMEQNIQGLFINPVVSVPKKFELYDNQLDLLVEVMNTWYNDPREVMALEIPTGVGKSIIGQCLTFLMFKHGMLDPTEKSIVLTSRKLLQSQYHKDFDYMMTIKGKANYICMLDLTKTVDKAPCNNSQDYECELKHNCDYYKLRSNIYKAKVLLPNYAWYLHNIDNYDNNRLGLQIFDEFHLVEDLLIDQFTIDIEALSSLFRDINDKYKYFDNSSITRLYSLYNIDDVLSECSIIANYLSYNLDLIEDKTKTVKDEIDRVLEVNLKIKNISSLRNDNNLSYTKNENKFYVTPLKNLMNRYFSKSKYNLLLTSTMNENYVKTNLCSKSMHYISRPSPFLVENRKIMVAPYFKVNYENLKDAKFVREFVDFIDSVIDVHPGVRGIIHTSSYQQVSIMLNSRHGKRLILNTAGSSINQLMEQFQSRPDSILVSPIVAEGYDFADDLARFGIVTKIPFLNWNDPIREVYGDYYYYQNSANKVVQQLGRTTRNHDDYSTNYILDENYNYLKSKVQLPQWLLDAEEYL